MTPGGSGPLAGAGAMETAMFCGATVTVSFCFGVMAAGWILNGAGDLGGFRPLVLATARGMTLGAGEPEKHKKHL